MSKLLEKHNISLPEGARKAHYGDKTEYHKRFHALKVICLKSHAFLIDLGSSSQMVAYREAFSSLQTTDGLSIHMGDDTQIQVEGKGSIKLKHGMFKDVLCALFSYKFVICIPDDTYWPTKVIGIWSRLSRYLIYLNWEDYSEGCCKPCLKGI